MSRIAWTTSVWACLAAAALAAAPDEAKVQGMYKGTWKSGDQEGTLEARVVALGKGDYKVYLEQRQGEKMTAKTELEGTTEGQKVLFKGEGGWEASTPGDGTIAGTMAGGTFQLRRFIPESPTSGKKPPEGAVVLLDGEDFSNMVRRGGEPWYLGDMSKDGWPVWEVPIRTIVANRPDTWPTEHKPVPEGWTLGEQRRRVDSVVGIGEDGSIRIPRGGMNSKDNFEGGFDLHVEFRCPLRATARGQGRGNSGVYLPCRTEIQVLDSFGMTTYEGGCCGGLYRWKNPDPFDQFPLACYPPLVWQTYDMEYRVRKDEKGKPASFLTVYHNGILIHDNVRLRHGPRKGRFHFQDHGNPVRYRNIWVLPLEEK
ncbi:MAG: DUF1080 domain-containing protein [Candidatus Brocadiia bacterium]